MEKGFLLLIGNYYDLVHYIEIDGCYYTLSRDHVEKIFDIDAGITFYIKKTELSDLEQARPEDPYYLQAPKLTAAERAMLDTDPQFKKIEITIDRNQRAIEEFQQLSIREDFAYFKNLEEEQVVLLKYTEV